MKSIQFIQANRMIKAPLQTEEERSQFPINDLPAYFDNVTGRWMSIWQPSAEELKILNEGGGIAAMVYGPQHPPIYIGAAALDFKEGEMIEEEEDYEEPHIIHPKSGIKLGGGIIL